MSRIRVGQFAPTALWLTALVVVMVAATVAALEKPRASMWHAIYFTGIDAEHYGSLDRIVAASDSVVLGRVLSLEPSRKWVADAELGDDGVAYYAKAIIEIESTLRGQPELDADGRVTLEFFVVDWRAFEKDMPSPPDERAVFFLRRKIDTVRPYYRLVSVVQGYFRDAGHVDPPIGADDPWVKELHGESFESLLERIGGR